MGHLQCQSLVTVITLQAVMAILIVITLQCSCGLGVAALQVGYYGALCPKNVDVEYIVYTSMASSYSSDKTVAPGVLRMAFHDCFVRGCEGSVLLDTANSEKTALINAGLHSFDAIDAAKTAVEKACPGVVSCADILQFAARDSVKLAGGQGWSVPAGRRDGTVSSATEATSNLPASTMTVPDLLPIFNGKGLTAAQMVTLSGAHTIGVSHCGLFGNRIYTYNSASGVDPTLPSAFAASLKAQCPSTTSQNSVDLDLVSPTKFDSQYYQNIIQYEGLLTSDQSMLNDSRTSSEIYANNGAHFGAKFGQAMVAMSQIGVLTGSSGQIRTNCRKTV